MTDDGPRLVVAVSLKAYFGHQQTLDWCREIAVSASRAPVGPGTRLDLVVLPSTPSLDAVRRTLQGTTITTGAQDVSMHPAGAHTGEVPATLLAELGCTHAEIGHAERRAHQGETDTVVAAKVAAAIGAGLTPLICVGESERLSDTDAAVATIQQLDAALASVADTPARVVVAYEPVWAIGAAEPAPVDHIRAVCTRLSEHLRGSPFRGSSVIYGGSAGPGLLSQLDGAVDGLFLGRFAHDPAAFGGILEEVAALTRAGGVDKIRLCPGGGDDE